MDGISHSIRPTLLPSRPIVYIQPEWIIVLSSSFFAMPKSPNRIGFISVFFPFKFSSEAVQMKFTYAGYVQCKYSSFEALLFCGKEDHHLQLVLRVDLEWMREET